MKYDKIKYGIIGIMLGIGACQPEEPTLRGNTYILRDSELEISLSFDAHDNRYFGKAVNRYYGTYRLEGRAVTFGPPSSTMYSGDEDDLDAEEAYLTSLPLAQTYTLEEGKLTLHLSNQKDLVFDIAPQK